MKRVYLKILSLIVVGLMLCGCYSYKTETTVNKDKSVDFKIEMSIDMSKYASMLGEDFDPSQMATEQGGMITDEQKAELKEKGYEVNVSQEGYKTTTTITKRFAHINDISSEDTGEVQLDIFLDAGVTEHFFNRNGDVYTGNIAFDLSSTDTIDLSSWGISPDKMNDMFKIEYRLNLPVKPNSNNATKVENGGKTLIWELTFGQKNYINYEFDLSKPDYTMLIIWCIFTALVFVGLYLYAKRKNKTKVVTPKEVAVQEEIKEEVSKPKAEIKKTPVKKAAKKPVQKTKKTNK